MGSAVTAMASCSVAMAPTWVRTRSISSGEHVRKSSKLENVTAPL
ncbi:hypothetical protein [Nocardia abscessus]|nr:hypothetical protein [Nocardia abscessus]